MHSHMNHCSGQKNTASPVSGLLSLEALLGNTFDNRINPDPTRFITVSRHSHSERCERLTDLWRECCSSHSNTCQSHLVWEMTLSLLEISLTFSHMEQGDLRRNLRKLKKAPLSNSRFMSSDLIRFLSKLCKFIIGGMNRIREIWSDFIISLLI